MLIAPIPANESSRLKSLLNYQILDTDAEPCYDDLTQIAAEICQTPIALVSLIDKDRQWFKSRVGLDAHETHRDLAFCAHAILQNELFIVENASQDPRFADNPLVADEPKIRFYAGTPLITSDGYALGTLCVIDREPKQLSDNQQAALKALGRQVVSQLELRLSAMRLERMNTIRDRLLAILSHDLKSSFNAIIGFSRALGKRAPKMELNDIVTTAGRIERAGDRAHHLLLAILEWSRQKLDSQAYSPEQVDARELCEAVIERMTDLSEPKQIAIQLHCPLSVSVWADKCLLDSAIQNLLSNAIKFSHPGGLITVNVSPSSDQSICFAVTDQGIGMSQEQADKIMHGLDIGTRPGTKGEQGSGLGTLLVNDFVSNTGGQLCVDSEIEKGCTVSFSVPAGNTAKSAV